MELVILRLLLVYYRHNIHKRGEYRRILHYKEKSLLLSVHLT